MHWTNEFARMSRRRFMETASAMGVPAASLFHGTREGLLDAADEGEVPYVAYLKAKKNQNRSLGEPPKRKPVYRSLPRDEWAARWTAVDLQRRVAESIEEKWPRQPITSVFRGMDRSPTGFGVEVAHVTEVDAEGNVLSAPDLSVKELRERLPAKGTGAAGQGKYVAEREDIPITVVKEREKRVNCSGEHGDHYQSASNDWDPVPGGIVGKLLDDFKDQVSFCAEFVHDDYGETMVSRGHDISKDWDVYLDTEYIGYVAQIVEGDHFDFSVIDKDNLKDFGFYIGSPDTADVMDYRVIGIVTNDGLIADVDTSETYYTQGWTTGRLPGELKGTGGCLGTCTNWFKSTQDVEAGDSGGTFFKVNPDDASEAYVAGNLFSEVNVGSDEDGDSCPDDTRGTTAETIEDKAPGTFVAYNP